MRSFASMSKYPTLTLQPHNSLKMASSQQQQQQQQKDKKKIVLIQDPPFQYLKHSGGSSSAEDGALKEAAMFEYIASFDCPVILIVSGLSGQDDVSFAVDRCIPQSLRGRSG